LDKENDVEKKKEKEKSKQKKNEDIKSILMSLATSLFSYKGDSQDSFVPTPLYSSPLLLLVSFLSFIHTLGLTVVSYLETFISTPTRSDVGSRMIQRLLAGLMQTTVCM
jgi:hypothetical protein